MSLTAAVLRKEPRHTSLQERNTHGTIREVQLTTPREEPTHYIWRRAPPHISAIEEKPCPMYLERRPHCN